MEKKNILVLGSGSIGKAVASKVIQQNKFWGNICLASRSPHKFDTVVKNTDLSQDKKISIQKIDLLNFKETVNLIKKTKSKVVINVASPTCNIPIMESCIETKTCYLDTSVAEGDNEENMPAPWYGNYEWKLKDKFKENKISALLSIGFDPGVVNVFSAFAYKEYFDIIHTIDILDINDGNHNAYFATNFDPETNLREIYEDVVYWENGNYISIPPHSKMFEFNFPEIGKRKLYSVGHDELHSLPKYIPAKRIEFWMGFNEKYLQVFDMLKNIGLLSSKPIQLDNGVSTSPIKILKAVLPKPEELAQSYTGKICIGTLVSGEKNHIKKKLFFYSILDHEKCFQEIGSHAVSYSTAIPVVTAAILLTKGIWDPKGMVNVEELDPKPFLELIPKIGITWNIQELNY